MSEEFEIENFEDLMNVFENTGDFGEYYLGDYSNIQIANYLRKMQQENKQLKELKYKFFDNCGDEESFTLEDYLEISNKLYDYEQENKQLKDGLHKILDLNKRAINCDSQKVTIKYLLKKYDLIYETLGELQPGLMKGDKENEI